jgi:hypothetical protein
MCSILDETDHPRKNKGLVSASKLEKNQNRVLLQPFELILG